MNNEQFAQAMANNGFYVESTGGGCTAWKFDRLDGSFVWVHQDLHHDIWEDLLATPDGAIEVGIDEGLETVAWKETNDIQHAMFLAVGFANQEVTQ